MINIKITKETRYVDLSKSVIGIDSENLQEELVFSFDEFVDGQARLEYEIDNEKYYTTLTKEDETYKLPVKNVLTKKGSIPMQLVITEGTSETEIPVFKSKEFYLWCEEAINAVNEAPEGYEIWIEQANAKLNQMDNVDIDITKDGDNTKVKITRKDGTTKEAIVSGGGSGTSDYEELDNKPQINGNELVGNKSLDDLGIQPKGDYAKTSDLDNYYNKTEVDNKTNVTVDGTTYTRLQDYSDMLIPSFSQALEYKQDKISDLEDIRSGASKGATALQSVPSDYKTKSENDNLYQAKGNYSLVTETGNKIELSINSSTYVMTMTLKDKNGNTLSTGTVDLPLETMVVDGKYDSETKKIILTLKNGNKIEFSIADLVNGLETQFRYETMPIPSEDNLGQIAQYIGETNSSYTNAYFYKSVQTVINRPASLSITQTMGMSLGEITYDLDTFGEMVEWQPNTYRFEFRAYPETIKYNTVSSYDDENAEYTTLTRNSGEDGIKSDGEPYYCWLDSTNGKLYYTRTAFPDTATEFFTNSETSDLDAGHLSEVISKTLTNGKWFIYNEDDEEYQEINIDDYGLSFEETPIEQAKFEATYLDEVTDDNAYAWEQINVQPIGGSSAVESVNGKTGTVVLTASDVGALPDTTTIPTKTSELTNDSNYVTNTDYATTTDGGVVKIDANATGIRMSTDGYIRSGELNYGTYQSVTDCFVGKKTLEAVITGKGLIDNTYHDSTKQDTISDLDTIRENASKVSTKQDTETIDTETTTTIALEDNTEYRRGELSSLELTLPSTTPTTFDTLVIFTSGETPTTLTCPEDIKWTGDGCENNEFTPEASKTYNCGIWYDGTNYNGIARGV